MLAERTQLILAAGENADCLSFVNTVAPFGSFRFMQILPMKQPWEYSVDQLYTLLVDQSVNPEARKRLVWLIKPDTLHIGVIGRTDKNVHFDVTNLA